MVLGVNELLIISAAPFNGLTTKLDTPDEANFPKADADADDRSTTAEAYFSLSLLFSLYFFV